MTCFTAQLKRVTERCKHIEEEARQLKLKGEVGDFEIHIPPTTIRVRVRPKTLCQKLNADMTSQSVLKFLTRAWTPHELRSILVVARTIEPALRRIANRNGKSKTFAPTIPDEACPNKIATSLAPCMLAFARGRPDAGADFYEPMIDLNMRHHPHRILRIKSVVAALKRWGAPAPHLTSDARADLDME